MRLWFSFEKSLLFNVGLSFRREKPEFIGAERLLHLFLDLLTYLTCCLWLLYFRLQTEFMPSQLKHKEYKKGDIHYRICGIWIFSHFLTFRKFQFKFSRTFWHLGNFYLKFPHFLTFREFFVGKEQTEKKCGEIQWISPFLRFLDWRIL